MTNTILRDNSAPSGADCSGTASGNNNLVENLSGCNLTGNDNGSGDPMLAPLGDYGGPTETRAIPKTSIAKDAGEPDACPFDDQRGVSRPQGAGCDIGAYEYDYVGDVNCSGFAEITDLAPLLGYIGGVASPHCIWRGNIDCRNGTTGTDVVYLIRHIAGLEELQRPQFCPDIGPDPVP